MWREEDLSRIGIEASSGGGDGGDGVIVVNGGTGNAAGDPPHKTKVKNLPSVFLTFFLSFSIYSKGCNFSPHDSFLFWFLSSAPFADFFQHMFYFPISLRPTK